MSLSHGKMYISTVDEENSHTNPLGNLIGVPLENQVVSVTESSLEQGSTPHYTTLVSLQQDKINTIQASYNSLLDKYQRKNADFLMKINKGSTSRKDYTNLGDINNSLLELGDDLLSQISHIQIDDKSIQRKIDSQKDEMQRHMGYLHGLGKPSDNHMPTNIVGYHIMSWTIVSVLGVALAYRYFEKGK